MAIHANSTLTPSDVETSLDNALWFIRNNRFLAALYALENELARCVDSRRDRIQRVLNLLGTTPVAQLAGGARV